MWCEEMLGTDTFLLLGGVTLALKGIAHTHFLSIPPELVSKFVVKSAETRSCAWSFNASKGESEA